MPTNRLLVKEEIATYAATLLDAAVAEGGQERVIAVRDQLNQVLFAFRENGRIRENLSNSSLSAQQRYEENTKMIDIVKDRTDDFDDDTLVTTVESAYKKFLGDEVTYTVAVYTVDDTALQSYDKDLETIRGMSKSKAKAVAGDGVMTAVGTAQVVVNEDTGEVISFQMK